MENIVLKVPFGEFGDIGDVLKRVLLGLLHCKIFLNHATRAKDAFHAFATYGVVNTTQA
jgi:predicted GNAT superfamily acetyltransferase